MIESKKSKSLKELGGWDVKTTQEFANLLSALEGTSTSKTLLNSLIKFEGLYKDIKRRPFSTDYWTDLEGINEERRAKRARLYLAKKDLLKVTGKGGNKKLILTSRAQRVFYEEYPLARLRDEKWDGSWTIITYDFPNTRKADRDYFRNKLKVLGFGCPQESLYVSPLPLSEPLLELIKGEELGEYVWVTRAQGVLGLTDVEVAKKAWALDKLASLYNKLLEVLPRVKKINEQKIKTEWQEHYLALDNADPYLPKELLPNGWPGNECKKEFERFGLPGLLRTLFH